MNALNRTIATAAACLVALTGIGASEASADVIFPETILAGFVTCIPDAGSSCTSALATTGQWRVVNALSPDVGGFPQSTDLLNASLVFSYGGGSLVWNWSILSPDFVETPPFDVSLLSTLTSLTFQATLADTTLALYGGDMFIANSPLLSATTTSFPPPLSIFVDGVHLHPVPEPATLGLLATGLLAIVRRKRQRGPSAG